MKRSGMAGVVAIVMVGLVGAAMVALTSQFSGEARRTQHTMAQAQLRQLLIVGTKSVQGQLDRDGRVSENAITLPSAMSDTGLKIAVTKRLDTRFEVGMEARMGRESLTQELAFEKQGDRWVLVAARLAP